MLLRRLAWFFAFLLVLGVTIVGLRRVDLEAVLHTMRLLSWFEVFIVLILQGVTLMLIAMQWRVILRMHGHRVSLSTIVKMNVIGAFFEGLTPAAKTGGELYKFKHLSEQGVPKKRALQVMLVQKGLSLSIFTLFLMMALVWWLPQLSVRLDVSLWLVFTLFLMLIGVLIGAYRIVSTHQHSMLKTLGLAFLQAKKPMIGLVLVSVLIWLTYPLKLMVLFWMFNLDVALSGAFVTTFIAYGVAQLPITLGGIGTFEGTFVVLLQALGVPQVMSLSVVLWFRFVTFWSVFLVGFIQLLTMTLKRARSPL